MQRTERSRGRAWRRGGALAVACCLAVAGCLALAVAALVPPRAGAEEPAAVGAPQRYYVAVGASESVGVQPAPEAFGHGAVRTLQGYANDVVHLERHRWPHLTLVHFGCPGITAEHALHGPSPCSFPAGSEVATAVRFLRAHRGAAVLATVDLGFNDVWPCIVHRSAAPTCLHAALGRVDRAVSAIVAELRAAGGRHLEIVGLQHNDPYLATYLEGVRGRKVAGRSLAAIGRLNQELARLYARADVSVANVPAQYGTGSGRSTVSLRRHARSEATRMCHLTWMCRRDNLHPDAAGYREIADAIAAALAADRSGAGG